MMVYDELPDKNAYSVRRKRSIPEIEGCLDRLNTLDFSYQWLLCTTKEIKNGKSSHIWSMRTNYMKLHPEYEWEVRKVSKTKHGLFGRRKQ